MQISQAWRDIDAKTSAGVWYASALPVPGLVEPCEAVPNVDRQAWGAYRVINLEHRTRKCRLTAASRHFKQDQ